MKKVFSVIMATIMLGSLVGCRNKPSTNNPPSVGSTTGVYTSKWSEDLPMLTFSAAAESVDWIDTVEMNNEAKLMVSSLKAVVNSKQPRIYTHEMKNSINWLADLGYDENHRIEFTDPFALALKYKDEIAGAILYDPEVPDTMNLASSMAGLYEGTLVCSPMVHAVFESRGLKLPVVRDLRNMFSDKYEVYNWMYDNIWSSLTHKVITCLNYEIPGYVRDYAIAAKSAVLWLSANNDADKVILRKFFADMPAGESALMGWFPEDDEAQFVALASEYGILTYASDLSENLTFLSGAMTPTAATLAEVPTTVENKVYVAFIVSDGDNLQYHQHQMRTWWDKHNDGTPDFPLTWTFSPGAYVLQPAIMDYYFKNAGDMNCFMAGPSGIAYTYPRNWTNAAAREKVFALTDKYCRLSGITVVNNWMAGAGGYAPLTEMEQNDFGKYYKNLLAVYDQVSLGGAKSNNGLLIDSLTVNYSQVNSGNYAFIASIDEAINNLVLSNQPQFVTLQGNPWDYSKMYENFQTTYNMFKNEANVEFVRMDTLAMLQRLSLGMSATR